MIIPVEYLPKFPDSKVLAQAAKHIASLEIACDTGENCHSTLGELKALTGNSNLTMQQYHRISNHTSHEEAAILAFCPEVRRIPDITFEQFLWICGTMLENLTSGSFQYWYELFDVNARKSSAGNLVFHPLQDWLDRLIDAKEIDPDTRLDSFEPTVKQLAVEAWRNDTIHL